jgi:bifunctional oligoribonuclease and PAP phosphatase NrnA
VKKVPDELVSFVNAYDSYILVGHREPDGDCVGSILALSAWLRRNGKKTVLLSAGPFKRPEIKPFESLFTAKLDPSTISGTAAVIVLDCSGMDRVGDASEGLDRYPTAIIDHHATNGGAGGIAYLDDSAPATTILVQMLIERASESVSGEEAENLLFGLCTDTGFFRHLDERSADTFSCAARLVARGANPKRTFARMNGGKSWGSRIIISRILSRMTHYYDGQLVVSWETLEDTAEYGAEGRDSDSLYQLVQSIDGVEAMVIVRQETPESCTVGFRSLDRIDVSRVASSFGGGGHRQASGLSINGTIEELIPRFVAAFADQFPGIQA